MQRVLDAVYDRLTGVEQTLTEEEGAAVSEHGTPKPVAGDRRLVLALAADRNLFGHI